MNWEALLFGLTLLLYFVSSVCYHLHLFAGSERARQVAVGTVVAVVLVHTAAIGGLDPGRRARVVRGPLPRMPRCAVPDPPPDPAAGGMTSVQP